MDADELREFVNPDGYIGVGPRFCGPAERDGPACSLWVGKKSIREIKHGHGPTEGSYFECVSHPLARFNSVKEIELHYTWPSVDWFDFSPVAETFDAHKEQRAVILPAWREPLGFYKFLRGGEQAFIDLDRNPDIVHYCVDRMFEFAFKTIQRIFEIIGSIPSGVVALVAANCDLGMQQGLMYSPAHIREYFLPGLRKIADLAHARGCYVFHHDDGAMGEIIPDLIGNGVDILNPVQWKLNGMDRESLKRRFGDGLVFHGGIDNQYTLPFGTEEEVRREVRDTIEILGRDGGYVFGPCHSIQSNTPVENVIAMYDEAYKVGGY